MRMLLVTPFVPHPGVGHGTATVATHVVEYFHRRHSLTVACFSFSAHDRDLAQTLSATGVDVRALTFPYSPARAWAARVASLVTRTPYTTTLFDVSVMRQLLTQLFAESRFDVVQFDTTFAGCYVDLVPAGTRTALVEIDFTVKPLERRYEHERSRIKRRWYRRELEAMRRYEPALCRRFDRVYAVSSEDRAALERLDPALHVGLFRYGAGAQLFQLPLKEHAGQVVLFVGAFLHTPNVEAVSWLSESIVPLVKARVGEARFTCVGADPPQALRRQAEAAGVTVTGRVPDVSAYLADADVGVVPLRSGGGVKLKTLEMMAAGRAIVTTPIGIEGIEAHDGEHVLVADTAEAFAAHIVRLLEDDGLRARLGRSARALALQHHQWANNLRRLEEDYLDLAQGERRLAALAV